ncbi:hypothetical protein SPRG_19349 [Saprolegnia parasitica CBS 223.65]|uniref:SPRY domain-containing protein n=1 Tax=Saprolegnia parasitica (strain CBS 223.65) TaxID=695850 RepID=A0A067CTD0_SAPPC|nr:hypothetical protein SPRG_19349 [Saprolegnia parasitica CBS 223.65]KDO33743.1 hypothetical protein SPRG_19349 [Saprolegnia parasitica CBS 223.65]|eukprot:XP_012195758.1 hypothetical protein SPRG_19349 [Saprolegnia parasitica CBS 223.65]
MAASIAGVRRLYLEPTTLDIREGSIVETPRTSWTDPFFTVDQDLFVLHYNCFAPKPFATDVEYQRGFGHKFGVERSMAQLEKRFRQLTTTATNRGILRVYLKSLLANATVEALDPTYAACVDLSERLETVLHPKLRLEIEMDGDLVANMDTIRIEVSGRSTTPFVRDVPKHLIRAVSSVVDSFLAQAAAGCPPMRHQALTYVPRTGTSREKMVLTDDVPAYDHIPLHNHFDAPVFDRMMLFAKDQDVVEHRMTLVDEYDKFQKTNKLSSDEINQIFEIEMKRYGDVLENAKNKEVAHTRTFLDQALQHDLQSIHAMHAATVANETARISAKYSAQRESLFVRIEVERLKALAMHRDSTQTTLAQLEHVMAVNLQQVDAIFGASEYLLQLMLLAQDLACKKLLNACVRYLTEPRRFQQFCTRRELTSPLLAETTLLLLLQHLPDSDAAEINTVYGAQFVYHEMLRREIHTRLISLTKALESLPNDALRDVMQYAFEKFVGEASSNPSKDVAALGELCKGYPHVLTKELQRRREFSHVKINPALLNDHLSLTEDDLLVELESSNRYCSAIGTKQRSAGEFGRWMFEVCIEAMDPIGASVAIGWEVPRSVLQWAPSEDVWRQTHEAPESPRGDMTRFGELNGYGVVFPGLTPGDDGHSFGILWQSHAGLTGDGMGVLYCNGKQYSGVPTFSSGDVVACTIDQDAVEPFVEFYLNGQLVIPVVNAGNVKKRGEVCSVVQQPLRLHSTHYALFPAATLFSSKDPIARVRFNFRGGFQYPIPGYEPYGAELLDLLEIAGESVSETGGYSALSPRSSIRSNETWGSMQSRRHSDMTRSEGRTSDITLTARSIISNNNNK